MTRRGVIAGGTALALLGCAGRQVQVGEHPMYGLIGKITALSGRRDALAEALMAGSAAMAGNISYVVAEDATDADALWVTEVWDSEASHRASLALPQVQEAIRLGRPLIASFETVATTRPIARA